MTNIPPQVYLKATLQDVESCKAAWDATVFFHLQVHILVFDFYFEKNKLNPPIQQLIPTQPLAHPPLLCDGGESQKSKSEKTCGLI